VLDVVEGVQLGVEVLGKRHPALEGARGGWIMRTVTRAEKGNTSGRVRRIAVSKLLPMLLALLAILMLPTACSKDTASSDNSTSIELEDALASGKPTLAGFVGKVCACKNITPTLEELAAEYEGKCNVLILEKDDNNELFSQYSIFLVPTQVYFDGSGTEVKRIVGASSKEEIVERLAGMGVA
jgi:thioredoxin 1